VVAADGLVYSGMEWRLLMKSFSPILTPNRTHSENAVSWTQTEVFLPPPGQARIRRKQTSGRAE
jgi:hypothetical protein